jgi:hypothetical protein
MSSLYLVGIRSSQVQLQADGVVKQRYDWLSSSRCLSRSY